MNIYKMEAIIFHEYLSISLKTGDLNTILVSKKEKDE